MPREAQAPTKRRLSVEVPERLHRQAKSKAADQGQTLTAVIIDLLRRFVGDKNGA